jgi:hypothetical protein
VLATTVLEDAFSRIRDVGWDALQGLTDEELTYRVDGETNTVAWLVWHLIRVQTTTSPVAGTEQVWAKDGWVDRFGLPFDERAVGFGQDADEVARCGPAGSAGRLSRRGAGQNRRVPRQPVRG